MLTSPPFLPLAAFAENYTDCRCDLKGARGRFWPMAEALATAGHGRLLRSTCRTLARLTLDKSDNLAQVSGGIERLDAAGGIDCGGAPRRAKSGAARHHAGSRGPRGRSRRRQRSWRGGTARRRLASDWRREHHGLRQSQLGASRVMSSAESILCSQ
jgi:hypothetical protein